MKFVRYQVNSDLNVMAFGLVKGDTVCELTTSFFSTFKETSRKYDINSVRLLPPVTPTKIIGLGYNYKDLVGDKDKYDEPIIFLKPSSMNLTSFEFALILAFKCFDKFSFQFIAFK